MNRQEYEYEVEVEVEARPGPTRHTYYEVELESRHGRPGDFTQTAQHYEQYGDISEVDLRSAFEQSAKTAKHDVQRRKQAQQDLERLEDEELKRVMQLSAGEAGLSKMKRDLKAKQADEAHMAEAFEKIKRLEEEERLQREAKHEEGVRELRAALARSIQETKRGEA